VEAGGSLTRWKGKGKSGILCETGFLSVDRTLPSYGEKESNQGHRSSKRKKKGKKDCENPKGNGPNFVRGEMRRLRWETKGVKNETVLWTSSQTKENLVVPSQAQGNVWRRKKKAGMPTSKATTKKGLRENQRFKQEVSTAGGWWGARKEGKAGGETWHC